MKKPTQPIILFLLLLITSSLSFARTHCGRGKGVCVDTGSYWGESAMDATPTYSDTWKCYCSGGSKDGKMYFNDDGCNSNCNFHDESSGCNQSDTGGPCDACGFQNLRALGSCYADYLCTTPCGSVPEFPGEGKVVTSSAFFLACLFVISRRKKWITS